MTQTSMKTNMNFVLARRVGDRLSRACLPLKLAATRGTRVTNPGYITL
jgi:hypothetical protein